MAALGSALQVGLSTIVIAHGTWWSVLSLLAIPPVRPPKRRAQAWRPSLVVIIPAHDEELLLGRTLESLAGANGSANAELLVVADNCSDRTAEIARESGATVLERTDPSRRGKSFALLTALAHLESRAEQPDGIVVIDADTTVDPSLLTVVTDGLESGVSALQVHYIAGPAESDLGRLRRLAFLLVHWARPLGNRRLGLGSTLKGNGMAFSWAAARTGLGGVGVTEDAASTLELARKGVCVTFEPRAWVSGFAAQDYSAAATQDTRWEKGRFQLMPQAVLTAVFCLKAGNLRGAAACLEVASLPLSVLLVISVASVGMGLGGVGSLGAAIAGGAALVAYAVLGITASRPTVSDLRGLRAVPRFLFHKLSVLCQILFRRSSPGWKRTARAS